MLYANLSEALRDLGEKKKVNQSYCSFFHSFCRIRRAFSMGFWVCFCLHRTILCGAEKLTVVILAFKRSQYWGQCVQFF